MRNIILAAVTAASLTISGPALAAGTGPAEIERVAKPRTELKLGYMTGAGHAAAVVLTCTPEDVHPQAKQVCATLQRVGGDPGKIVPADTMCTMEYAPVTATATGTFRGKPVKWSHQFGNKCVMRQATGMLFAF